ncbi:hypothetical protein LR48_Vigan04g131600 [Vigna angularis]|uniref:Uncharacterized protein n=1 Tax=Phaseolus angularis TaxID=3914 RepID=A0A0L9UEF0_PHAAN|nr:hypothetical protein LR48_Vigan04g131600 [Vigna angularis]
MVLTWTPAQICEENKRGTRAKHRGMAETKDGEKKREEGGGVGVGFHCCVIADEIKHCAHAVRNKSPLGHPSLITHLCELAEVNTSTLPLEHQGKEIDASYYTQYCMLDEAGLPMPAPQPPQAHRRAPQQA